MEEEIMDKEQVKDIRKNLGISQEKLAQKLRVSRMSVYNWEKGIKRPSQLALRQLKRLMKKGK